MAENWLEIAQKMAEAARAKVVEDRKRLEQIRDRQIARPNGPTVNRPR